MLKFLKTPISGKRWLVYNGGIALAFLGVTYGYFRQVFSADLIFLTIIATLFLFTYIIIDNKRLIDIKSKTLSLFVIFFYSVMCLHFLFIICTAGVRFYDRSFFYSMLDDFLIAISPLWVIFHAHQLYHAIKFGVRMNNLYDGIPFTCFVVFFSIARLFILTFAPSYKRKSKAMHHNIRVKNKTHNH